jgi:hypothetical protein
MNVVPTSPCTVSAAGLDTVECTGFEEEQINASYTDGKW